MTDGRVFRECLPPSSPKFALRSWTLLHSELCLHGHQVKTHGVPRTPRGRLQGRRRGGGVSGCDFLGLRESHLQCGVMVGQRKRQVD